MPYGTMTARNKKHLQRITGSYQVCLCELDMTLFHLRASSTEKLRRQSCLNFSGAVKRIVLEKGGELAFEVFKFYETNAAVNNLTAFEEKNGRYAADAVF